MEPKIQKAIEDLTKGKFVIVVDPFGHGKLTGSVDHISPSQINFMVTKGRGKVSVGIEKQRASKLELSFQDSACIDDYFPSDTISVDVVGTTTMISAFELFDTIKAFADPTKQAEDSKRPNHVFPVIAHQDGIFGEQSHIEAGIELTKLCHSSPVAVMCDILNEYGEISKYSELVALSSEFNLEILSIDDLMQHCLINQQIITVEKQTKVKNRIGEFELQTYSNKIDSYSDYIFYHKSIHDKGVSFVYLHKECDLCALGVCDCHFSLNIALSKIKNLGGVIVYINHREQTTILSKYASILGEQLLTSFGIRPKTISFEGPSMVRVAEKEKISL